LTESVLCKKLFWFFFENAPPKIICNGTSFFADDRFWFLFKHILDNALLKLTSKKIDWNLSVQKYSWFFFENAPSQNNLQEHLFLQTIDFDSIQTHSRQCIVETWHQKIDWNLSCAKSYSWFFFENAPSKIICNGTSFFATDRLILFKTHLDMHCWNLTSKRLTENLSVQKVILDSSLKMHPPKYLQWTSFFCRR